MSTKAPNKLSKPIRIYRFEEVNQATVFLDQESNTWFMYYRGDDYYGVKIAPVAFQEKNGNHE
jgi:hypothetical protein